jgi:hypothetical protein
VSCARAAVDLATLLDRTHHPNAPKAHQLAQTQLDDCGVECDAGVNAAPR